MKKLYTFLAAILLTATTFAQTPTTNVNGLVTLEIGDGTVVSGDFTTIDWSADSYFIKTETDPTGGTMYTITGTSQLLSVPYALHAKTAEAVTNESQTIEQVLVLGNDANGNPRDIDPATDMAARNPLRFYNRRA